MLYGISTGTNLIVVANPGQKAFALYLQASAPFEHAQFSRLNLIRHHRYGQCPTGRRSLISLGLAPHLRRRRSLAS